MLKARQGKEVKVTLRNEMGALSKLAKVLAEKGINILAMSCWVEGEDAIIRLVTDDMLRTTDALGEHGFQIRESDVVLLDAEHKPGILRHLTDRLARANIDLTHLYETGSIEQETCLVVLSTTNNDTAIVELNA